MSTHDEPHDNDDSYCKPSCHCRATEHTGHGLRERIAAVLYEIDHPGESIDEASDGDKDLYRRNADAVIRELGLRECRDPGCDCLHKFVTD